MITVDDMTKIFGRVLKVAYRAQLNKMTDEELAETITFWAVKFKDDDLAAFVKAIEAHIDSSQFLPTISEIRERMPKVRSAIPEIPALPMRLGCVRIGDYLEVPYEFWNSLSELRQLQFKLAGKQITDDERARLDEILLEQDKTCEDILL